MLVRTDTLKPWHGERLHDDGGTLYPLNIEQLWSADELLAIGLVPADPFAVPDGKVTTGAPVYALAKDGSVTTTYELADEAGPTLDDVKAECARRIYGNCSAASQSNLNGYMNLLNSIAIATGSLTGDQQADAQTFAKAMQWIGAMRSTCAKLVGRLDYTDDSNWPTLPQDVATFANRF